MNSSGVRRASRRIDCYLTLPDGLNTSNHKSRKAQRATRVPGLTRSAVLPVFAQCRADRPTR
jgi:hypothetical protein